MGQGSWSSSTYSDYASTVSSSLSKARSAGMSDMAARAQVFTRRQILDDFDPKKINVRESRDSEEHPESNAIILGVDVTGSMGIVAEKIITGGLGKLIEGILERKPVSDPQIMVMGVGDLTCDYAPLQVTQFETDIRIAEQLSNIWQEGHGGGNGFESYDIPWEFAGKHTSIDCFEKRNKKGYLFTIGDEPPPPPEHAYGVGLLKKVFNGVECALNSADMLESAKQKYNVFHVICEQGSFCSYGHNHVLKDWDKILGKRALLLDNYDNLPEVIISAIMINEGADPENVINSWEKPNVQESVRHSIFR
jgi:hypothetical protein